MQRILIIEDDEQLARLLELELTHAGYQVDLAADGIIGLSKLHTSDYDLTLLDVMLPGVNGYDVCKQLRQFTKMPVIMLTAKDSLDNKIAGLDSGADDYVTKPFAMEELAARIRAALRRTESDIVSDNRITIHDLCLDLGTRDVFRNGISISLSKREFDLLEYLMRNKNIVLSRDRILENIWGYDFAGDSNTVDVYIRYLRSKVDDPFSEKLIHTYRGVGYSIKE